MSFPEEVVYQVYPKSFYDSDGDGIGDLPGVLEKVDYIASLGVKWVWFNPFFVSPQNDNGYDIADYYAINPDMGTMQDVEALISALAERGIGVMFDMVLNHVSTEHEWFQRALAGEKEYQDFFYLRPLQEDASYPTNWESKFGGAAWAQFGDTDLYYLHLYDVTQADLNWHNPRVREELFKVVNFWREKGVKGFRFDVINVIGKDEELRDAPAGVVDKSLYTDTPQVHPWIHEMNRASFGTDPDAVTVGEMSATTIEHSIRYTNPANQELHMVFNFHHLKVDYEAGDKWSKVPFDFEELKNLLHSWGEEMEAGGGWNALFWNNHDQPRAINRFGDAGKYRVESATMLASSIHLSRGTPFVYMGEELGMIDPAYESMADYVDIESHNANKILNERGLIDSEAFEIIAAKSRDNSRTPMQWDASPNAGFTTGTPWLRPTNFSEINVAAEETEGKVLPFYKRLISLRAEMPLISRGSYKSYAAEHPSVYAYLREYEGQKLLVLNNFYGEQTEVEIPTEFVDAEVLVSNYEAGAPSGRLVQLRPYETLALLI